MYQNISVACLVGFLAYCIYFDHKRRSAPDFKDKVRARRERQRLAKEREDEVVLPPVDDEKACEKFFIKQIELGEKLINEDEMDRALKHFGFAVALCPQPQQLIQYLKDVLPTNAYVKLVEQIKIANKRVEENYRQQHNEEDVE